MKIKHFLMVIAALVAGSAGYLLRVPHTPRGPAIECIAEIDFGAREYGEIATAPFTVANTGDRPLHLEGIRSDCSCTGLEQEQDGGYAKVERLTVGPGKSVELLTRLMVRGRMGEPERHTISFRTNDPHQPEQRIALVVPMVKGVFFSPNALLFGDVPLGARVEQILTVRHEGNGSFNLDRVEVSDASVLSAELLPPGKPGGAPPASRVRVVVAPQRAGRVEGSVTAYFRRGGVAMSATVLISARGVEAVTAAPVRVLLPKRSQSGWVYEATVLCRSHSDKTLSLQVQECPEDLSVETAAAPRGAGTQVVRISWNRVGEKHRPGLYKVVLVAKKDGRANRLAIEVECAPPEGLP